MELCWIIYFIVCGVFVLITSWYIWSCISDKPVQESTKSEQKPIKISPELINCRAVNSLLIQIEPFIYDERLTGQENVKRLWLYCLELFKEIYDLEPEIFVNSYQIASCIYLDERYLNDILRLMCHEELLEKNAKGFRFICNSETTRLLANAKPIPKEG